MQVCARIACELLLSKLPSVVCCMVLVQRHLLCEPARVTLAFALARPNMTPKPSANTRHVSVSECCPMHVGRVRLFCEIGMITR